MIVHVLGSHKYNISGYAWRQCMCIFACEIKIPLLMLLASILNSHSMHVCFRKGWGSVGAHHMDLVSGYLGKRVGVVRIMCPRAPSSYSSSSDYSLTLARLVARCYFWCSGCTHFHVLPFPKLRRCLSWPNGACPRCHGLVFGWEEQLSTLTRPSSSWWTKWHGGIRVSKTATWTPRGPGTHKQCLNENVCHYSN